jgi:hypothetical protein
MKPDILPVICSDIAVKTLARSGLTIIRKHRLHQFFPYAGGAVLLRIELSVGMMKALAVLGHDAIGDTPFFEGGDRIRNGECHRAGPAPAGAVLRCRTRSSPAAGPAPWFPLTKRAHNDELVFVFGSIRFEGRAVVCFRLLALHWT